MRNLSTGTIAYLSHLPQRNPTIKQIHKHIHKCKTSLNFSKKSYLPVWAFHLFQFLGQFPFLFYPIWSEDGVFSKEPFVTLKEAILGKIITSSKSNRLLFWGRRRFWEQKLNVRWTTVPAILTNIPGPPESAELAGSRILRWTALPPQGGRGTVAIGELG